MFAFWGLSCFLPFPCFWKCPCLFLVVRSCFLSLVVLLLVVSLFVSCFFTHYSISLQPFCCCSCCHLWRKTARVRCLSFLLSQVRCFLVFESVLVCFLLLFLISCCFLVCVLFLYVLLPSQLSQVKQQWNNLPFHKQTQKQNSTTEVTWVKSSRVLPHFTANFKRQPYITSGAALGSCCRESLDVCLVC